MPDTELVVCCPKCGSADIREKNVAYAELPVLGWERDKDGLVSPTDYDTGVEVDWECEDVSRQYVCHGCGHRMSLDDLSEGAA